MVGFGLLRGKLRSGGYICSSCVSSGEEHDKEGGADHEMEQLQLEFEDDYPEELEEEDTRDSAVYARESEGGRPPGLYCLIHWKDTTSSEGTWEPDAGIKHLRRLVCTFHQDHPQKPTATSSPIDTGPPRPPLAQKSFPSSAILNPDFPPVSNDIPTKAHPMMSKETPPRLGDPGGVVSGQLR